MGIPADTLPFLRELAANNNREWFNEQKPRFVSLQKELLDMIEHLLGQVIQRDPNFIGVEAKRCLFRIYKDARFAKGVPYKTNFGIHIVASGHRADFERAGFYLHIEPGASFIAGGAHSPSGEWLKRIRREIALRGDDFEAVLNDKIFKKWFGELQGASLVRPPAGYSAESPHLELLKRKAMLVSHALSDADVVDKKFISHCAKTFEIYQPFMDFLNAGERI